jgi:hypothetical protein
VAAARLDTATTQAESDDSTKIATTAYVVDKITTLIGGAPSTLNDLNELAAAINDDANYNSTLTTALATKLPLAGGTVTGLLTSGKDVGINSEYLVLGDDTSNRQLKLTQYQTGGANNNAGHKINASSGYGELALAVGGTTAMTLLANSNVGIGTSAPVQPLHIASSSTSRIQMTNNASGSTSNDGYAIGMEGTTRLYHWLYENSYMLFATNNAERMRIDASGSVGINVSNPSSFNSGAYNLVVGSPSAPSQGITIAADTNSIMYFADGTSGAEAYMGSIIYNHLNNDMTFRTNGFNTAIVIDSSQNVGIGCTPLSSLHVSSAGDTSITLQTTNAVDNNEIWQIQSAGNASNHADLIFRTRTNAGSGGSEAMRITSDGAVVVNNAGGDAQIYLGGTGGADRMYLARSGADAILWNVDDGNLKFGNNNAERMRISSAGIVTTPFQPYFYAHRNGGNYTASGGTTHKVAADGLLAANGSHYSTSNARFTCPVAGVYQFNGNVNIYFCATGSTFAAFLRVNGASYTQGGRYYSGGTGDLVATVGAAIKLSAGDYVELWFSSSDTSVGLSSGNMWNVFTGYLVG